MERKVLEITRIEDGSFLIANVEPPLLEIFMAIPGAAEPEGSAAATERLFPDPATGRDAAGIREEWQEFIRPELQQWFENASATVEADLEPLQEGDIMAIPVGHIDAWLNTLNQARLVLAARFNVGEGDMERPDSHLLESERDFAIFQIHFYGFLQECLIKGMDEG